MENKNLMPVESVALSPTGQQIMIEGQAVGSEPLVGAAVVAAHLGIAKATVFQRVYKRQIPFYKICSSVRFRISEIDEWLKEQKIEPGDEKYQPTTGKRRVNAKRG